MSGLVPERCVTCSDEAVEAEVVAVAGLTAVVRVDGVEQGVAIDLVPTAVPGDVLLCHAGIALERLELPPAAAFVAQSHKVSAPAGGRRGRTAEAPHHLAG